MVNYQEYVKTIKNVHGANNLPVPELEETLPKFLKWVKPLVTKEEFLEAQKLVKDFQNDALSSELQEQLVKKASEEDNNWMSDWWLKYAYLATRGPVTPETNAPLSYTYPAIEDYSALEQLAIIMHGVANLYLYIKVKGIPKQEFKNGQISLDQLHGIFAAIRVPQIGFDEYLINEKVSTNVLFMYKNIMYSVEVIKNNQVVEISKIYNSLKEIVAKNIEQTARANANNITAATSREDASKTLETILKNSDNQEKFDKVCEAIAAFSYDDYNDFDQSKELINTIYNNEYFNRFHGKCMSYTMTSGGLKSLIADHTFVDGGTEVFVVEAAYQYLSKLEIEIDNTTSKTEYQLLDFEVANVEDELNQYFTDFKAYCQNVEFDIVKIPELKREILKENGILSADGFIHIVFQLAQYELFNKFENTYIAVDNRSFFRGRTECVRPISSDSEEFVKRYLQNPEDPELRGILIDALNEHYSRLKECQKGHGVNRHLFGLKIGALEAGKSHPLFASAAWKKIENNRLSTSSVVHPLFRCGFFQPVEENGFGIAYVVNDSSWLSLSSFKAEAAERKELIVLIKKHLNGMLAFIQKEGK